MTTSPELRIERPYATVEDYLAGDAWTVERTDMVLIGLTEADGLAVGSAVSFTIVLSNGEPVVSGEGRVVEPVAERPDRPGGLRVRFRKLDAPSKAVLRRALEAQRSRCTPSGVPQRLGTPEPVTAAVSTTSPLHPFGYSAAARVSRSASVATTEPEREPVCAPAPVEPSGVRHRAVGVVSPPENRDALLDRLRARSRRPEVVPTDVKRRTAAE